MKTSNPNSWETVAHILCQVISRNNFPISHCKVTPFNSVNVPRISLYDYFNRIYKYVECSDVCYVTAFIYIDRAIQNEPSFFPTQKNIHRLVLGAVILAIKYNDDIYADNQFYAKVGGISLKEINSL